MPARSKAMGKISPSKEISLTPRVQKQLQELFLSTRAE